MVCAGLERKLLERVFSVPSVSRYPRNKVFAGGDASKVCRQNDGRVCSGPFGQSGVTNGFSDRSQCQLRGRVPRRGSLVPQRLGQDQVMYLAALLVGEG